MTLLISFLLSSLLYLSFYYLIMPQDVQEKLLYFHAQTPDDKAQASQPYAHSNLPNLISHISIGNSYSGYYKVTESDFSILMENEFYNAEIEFLVQETPQNFNIMNILVQATFSSFIQKS
mmetsp:Transcript_25911/g.25177  ORF Transcript_25911/g.25177 Transcript_25911/m.25177 type:complete len:120 (-) Transcript_25911:596-955(-)